MGLLNATTFPRTIYGGYRGGYQHKLSSSVLVNDVSWDSTVLIIEEWGAEKIIERPLREAYDKIND